MKILYSLPHPGDRLEGQRAGHIVRANSILNGLAKLGHTVIRIEAGSDKKAQAAVNTYRNMFKRLLPTRMAWMMRDAGRIVHGRRFAARLIEAAEKHKPDCILETYLAFNSAGKIASETTGLPLVIDDIAPAWEEEQQYGVGLKEPLKRIYRQVTGSARLLVAVNKTIRQYLVDEGLPENRIVTVENGIDDGLFHPNVDGSLRRRQYGIGGGEVVIVFVGSFQPYHRVDLLLQAFAGMKSNQSARLLLVGEGKYTDEARAVAARLNLSEKTIFTGRIPYDEVSSYMAAGDIAVMPATNEYGNPMKVYEYMALGKAVVAPDQPTITEIVEHNENAYLFERENIPALTFALQTLTGDPVLRGRLGCRASVAAVQHTWLKRAEALQNAMEEAGLRQ